MSSSANEQTTTSKPKKKNSWMTFLQVAMLIGIIGGIYLSFNGNVLATTPGVPALIAGFSLSHVEVGDKALAEIRDLYGEDVTYYKAYLVHYRGNSGGVTVRVGEKREVVDAERAASAIVAGTEKGEKKGYADLKKLNVAGRIAYSLKVNGMPYFLYQLDNKVMWVDAMEGDPNQALTDVVRTFK